MNRLGQGLRPGFPRFGNPSRNSPGVQRVTPKKDYYISSSVRALETDFKCPEDLSFEHKAELADIKTEKH